MFNLGPPEFTVMFLIAVVLLGPKRLPAMAQSLRFRRLRGPQPVRHVQPLSGLDLLLLLTGLALSFAVAALLARP